MEALASASSRRLKQKLDFDCLIRKLDCTAWGSIKYARIKQGSDITVHSFHVPADPTGRLSDGDGSHTAKGLQEFPAPGGEHLP